MENTNKQQENKGFKDHKIILDNQKKASVTGVSKAVSSNPQLVCLQLQNTKLNIAGNNLFLSKLDTVSGEANVEGVITSVKYLSGNTEKGFFKRLFK